MLEAKEVKEVVNDSPVTAHSLESFIMSAQVNHINYVFLDKKLVKPELIDDLKSLGYSIVVGQGEEARVKISW